MTGTALGTVLRHLRLVVAGGTDDPSADSVLLHRFTAHRDDASFEALVARHGPMVLGVCRSVLRHEQDAEDAFQATFLALARKASTIRRREALAGWLFGVAYRVAVKAHARAARRPVGVEACEERVPDRRSADPLLDMTVRDLRRVVCEELQHLPERYRLPIVLCYLEERSQDEAARQLGWGKGVLRGRLDRGRHRLRVRLARRGLALELGLLTTVLCRPAATAVPAALAAATVRAAVLSAAAKEPVAVPATVAALAAGEAMRSIRLRITLTILLAGSILAAGTGALAHRLLAEPPQGGPVQKLPRPSTRPAPAEGTKGAKESVTVGGRVLDADGKPVAGARLYWPRLLREQPQTDDDVTIEARGTTGADGRFRVELPRPGPLAENPVPLIAAADGYGVQWVELPRGARPDELTLRLVKDQPVRGRVLTTEGRPVVGAAVRVRGLFTSSKENLDDFLDTWKDDWESAFPRSERRLYSPLIALKNAATDNDGRFEFRGIGAERVALLLVSGPDIAKAEVFVVNRAGFDAKAFNDAIVKSIPPEYRAMRMPPSLSGPTLTLVAGPTQLVFGQVREAGTGLPVVGATVSSSFGHDNGVQAVTDERGRYRLAGLPRTNEYSVHVRPKGKGSLLPRSARVSAGEGLGPVQFDFELGRGTVVKGRLVDRSTGKGVRGGVRFAPLPGNEFFGKPGYDAYKYDHTTTTTDAGGHFRLVLIPGSGVLMAQVFDAKLMLGGQWVNPYKTAAFSAADARRVKVVDDDGHQFFTAVGGFIESLTTENAVKVLDLAPDAGEVSSDLMLDRGRTQTVRILDPDGKPLAGAIVSGMTASFPIAFRLEEASCTAYALDPARPRRLVFFHAQRKLAGSLTVRGDEKEAPAVRLAPAGAVAGRVLDVDGGPVARADVVLSFPGNGANELYRHFGGGRNQAVTDKDGRFRMDGVIPELKFGLGITRGRTYFVGEPKIGLREVAAGKTLELGDVKVKPAN